MVNLMEEESSTVLIIAIMDSLGWENDMEKEN